mmetsp:Transcript_30695/g.55644  ORF Transcript_30695/g.55644 Transcript_30695/m.55644 type:complete len:296 (+) Transcript_30695:337-1224(+)
MRRKRSFWERASVASFWERGADAPGPPPSYSIRDVMALKSPPAPLASNIVVSFILPPPRPMVCTRSASSAIASRALTASTSRRTVSTLRSKSCNTSQKYGLGMDSIRSTCAARTSMICCRAMASMLVMPDMFNDEAGVPPLLFPAPAGAVPPNCAAVGCAVFESPTIPRKLDSTTPRRAATFSMGHAPCIFAWTAASPARALRCWASVRLVSADWSSVWIEVCMTTICWGRGTFDGSRGAVDDALLEGVGRRGEPAAASAGERLSPRVVTASSTFSKAGAMVFTEANVLRCCIMS